MKNLPASVGALREFRGYFKKTMGVELVDLIKREERLRVSGFPYCALKAAFAKMEGHVEVNTNAKKEWYTSIGTVAHTIMQRWAASGGRIVGNWKCYNPKCKGTAKFCTQKPCPKCSGEMEYVELEVKFLKNLSGHVDGVYKTKAGKYWVIDYKTSSVKTISMQKQNPTLPYAKNKAQIMSYCALLEQKYGIEIEGWALIYIARDKPDVVKIVGDTISSKLKRAILKRCTLYDAQFEVVQNIKSADDIKYLIDTKPCKTIEFYHEHHKGFKGCPLEAVCFTKYLERTVLEALEEYLGNE